MPYVQTFDRTQMMMCSWDSFVDPESIARLIDAFVDSLDLKKYHVREAATEGRPSYDPRGMYKLYIYGSRKGIRSSRKLEDSCKVNLEVKWMMGGAEPDFRTISEFRKVNIDSLKEIFHEFNRRISGAVEWGFSSIDGSKFLANNSKDNNFTKNKLDDRIKWLNAHTDEYLRILKEMDEREDQEETPENLTREIIETKLKEAKERLEKYEGYQKLMEETGASQLSVTDADARLMKNKNGFAVAYNPQTAVDSETHLIRDFAMTNQVT
ncbi:transposase, partial [Bariatricus sp. HCP28S3_D3]|uniref:transposase n=1 Tax=Bariatricus sp. HCP28S3_D3 TaxID=3438901 RepID=UPI003F889366